MSRDMTAAEALEDAADYAKKMTGTDLLWLRERAAELRAQASPAADWQHLKPFGYAPGNYIIECQACKSLVSDVDKRAITCRPCAEKAYAAAISAQEPVAQVVLSGKWNMPILRWLSADHSFRVPIGSNLYTVPPADERVKELEGLLREAEAFLVRDAMFEPMTTQQPNRHMQLVYRIRTALGE